MSICRVCGGGMEVRVTDMPFKIGDSAVAILKEVPVLQCAQCGEIEIEQQIMVRVEKLLASVDRSAELEVIRYVA